MSHPGCTQTLARHAGFSSIKVACFSLFFFSPAPFHSAKFSAFAEYPTSPQSLFHLSLYDSHWNTEQVCLFLLSLFNYSVFLFVVLLFCYRHLYYYFSISAYNTVYNVRWFFAFKTPTNWIFPRN